MLVWKRANNDMLSDEELYVRVLPNNHRIRKSMQPSEGIGGQKGSIRENEKEDDAEKKFEEEKKKEEAKEKAVERTQAIRNSLSKLRSKFDQIRK